MNRRGFIAGLFGAAGALTLDPERLLWVPGARRIFIPPPAIVDYRMLIPPGMTLFEVPDISPAWLTIPGARINDFQLWTFFRNADAGTTTYYINNTGKAPIPVKHATHLSNGDTWGMRFFE